MGLRAPARWGFAALLAITAFTGCKESETRPVKNAVSLEFAPCLGSGPAGEGDAGSNATSVCRERLDSEAPDGEVNACVLLRDADLPDKVYRVALKWADGTATSVNDPLIDIAPGKTIEGEFYLLRTAGSASVCDPVQFGQACGEGCLLRLTQPATLLGQDATALDFRSGGQCTTEWGPPVAGGSAPVETCNDQDDDCDGKSDEGLFCDGDCQTDENCADRAGTPVCDTAAGRCVRCLPGTHAGCGTDELCCDGDGARTCRPTAPGGECETCGVACGVGADACQDRTCVCGAGGTACGGNTPLCVGGTCVACDDHDDCGSNSLCCGGACVPTSLEGCSDCGSGCAVGTATACVNRACKCGGFDACTGTSGLCLTDGQARCAECDGDERCTFDAGRTQCVNDTCRQCDTADSAGCDEASITPICGAGSTCLRCQNNGQCELRPGTLDFCLADGACHQCAPDLNNTLGTDSGCTPLAPFCDAGACRECQRDEECPGLCVDGQCAGCDPETNAGCPAEAPICNVNRICETCSRDDAGDGTRVGDADCNKGLPEGAPARLCTVQQTCEICDMGENHRGCTLDNLCCVGAGGVPDCQPTEFLGANGCEQCGVACDPDITNGCGDRQCLCDVAGEACAPPQVCKPDTGLCQNCRDNGDCPLDSQCCMGQCIGTGPGEAAICTGCDVGANSCAALSTSTCNDRVCGCGNNPECGGDRPVCDDAFGTCVACLDDTHCAGLPGRNQCVNKACVECDADPLAYDGCGEASPEPICVNGNCRGCNSSLDCQVRPGNLDQCDNGECVECLVVPAGQAAPGCNQGAPICQNNVCRPCAQSAECGAGRECVGGSCESCDPNGDVGCGGTQPICDDGTLRCRGCTADNECPNGSICTQGDGRCVACDLASHRGCNNNQLCCGALPGQTCVALDAGRCTSCNNGACDPNTANRCAPRAGDNTVGTCDCGNAIACSGALAFCDGNAPNGGCVGCRGDNDCGVPGLTQCVTNGNPVNGADPALCRACDPDVAANLSGCDFNGNQPFCHRIGAIPNQQVSCVACANDAECTGHPSGSQCVATGACKLCDPANGANSAGCILSSAAPYCGNNFVCRGCANDAECAATAGNGNLCHEAANGGSGQCFACNDGVKNGTETGIDCGGTDCPNKCGTGQGCTNGQGARDCISGVCTGGICQAPTCNDTVRNGTETDLDCGGGSCPACANGLACVNNQGARDCVSGVCTNNVCQGPGCLDSVKNGTETDVDCGGAVCGSCGNGLRCSVASDCASGVCSGNGNNRVCQVPTCNDGVRNGAETATDCGGGTCGPCANGQACANGFGVRDCASGVCTNSVCQNPTCNDGVKNANETAVDCGGGGALNCGPCANGLACVNNQGARDCQSGVCTGNICRAPACNDSVKNGAETATDCGGGVCPTCANGQACVTGAGLRDCVSGVCTANICQAPTCFDGVQNGNEVGIDCRGVCNNLCPDGRRCLAANDCVSGVCNNNICGVASCNDGVKNGVETGVDCGGGACPKCGNNIGCVNGPQDCVSLNCINGLCAAPTCVDVLKNGAETATDCGGGTCPGCANGLACVNGQGARDCLSGVCTNALCQIPNCADGVRNGGEVGIDCRGPCPALCGTGLRCDGPADCVSGVCTGNICQAATCNDGVKNAAETGIDCGGGTCGPCADGLACATGQGARDCINGVCTNNICQPASCNDGVRNGGEVGIDCRGPCPNLCGTGLRCVVAGDCVSGVCSGAGNNKTCAAPTCNDGVKNGNESDVDCGGGTCNACANGKACTAGTDCSGTFCNSNICAACSGATHTPCNASNLCCPSGDVNAPQHLCRGTTADPTIGCTACGVGCDLLRANVCSSRTCKCGGVAACAGNLFCRSGGSFGTGACVACRNNADCGGATPTCVEGACRVCDATTDAGCANPQFGQCLANNACVECIVDGDCGDPALPACVNNACVICDSTDNQGCGGATPFCKTNTSCVACLVTGDCPANNTCTNNACVPN